SAATHNRLPRKNGAPGREIGAAGLIATANSPFESNGARIAAPVMTLVVAPCSSPWCVGGTERDIRPCTAGPRSQRPGQYSGVTAYMIQPWLPRPQSAIPMTATTSEVMG